MIGANSPITEISIRAATPLALLISAYLLFAGHNNPGGGFAAGLVLGAVVTLRTLVGLQRPTYATSLLVTGVLIVVAVAIAPLLWGNPLLDMAVVSIEAPVVGTIKSGSAFPFDVGVTAIVVGLVIALLDGLSDPTTENQVEPEIAEGTS